MIDVIERVVEDTVREQRRKAWWAESDDVHQEAWVEALENLPRFDPDRGDPHAFFGVAARRRMKDLADRQRVRDRHLQRVVAHEMEKALSMPESDVEEAELRWRRREAIEQVLAGMTVAHASIIRALMDGNGNSNAEVAAKLGVPMGMVYRARYVFVKRAKTCERLRSLA